MPLIRAGSLPVHTRLSPGVVGGQRVLLHPAKPGPASGANTASPGGCSSPDRAVGKSEMAHSLFARHRLPTEGNSCISPYALAYETTEGLNSDSCRISEATRYGSRLFFADSALIVSHHASGKQNPPVRQRDRLDGSRRRIGQRPLQRPHGAIRLPIGRIDLRLGQRAPRRSPDRPQSPAAM
jgi:hypothetical protein